MKRISILSIILVAIFGFAFILSPSREYPVVAQGAWTDFYFNVGAGRAPNTSQVLKFGQNTDVDNAAAEDVWDGGGTWNEPTATQVYTITSTDANDTSAGTGARTVQIYGLNSTGAEADETLTMNGTNPVTASTQYQMIYRMIVRTAGSGAANAGIISANANTDGNVTAQINAGNNQTLMAVYKVPVSKRFCITSQYAGLNRQTTNIAVNISLFAKPDGEVWQVKKVNGLVGGGTSRFVYSPPQVQCFDPLTIIKMQADTSADNADISAGFDGVLIPQ